mgnify:CR=1 FL=1
MVLRFQFRTVDIFNQKIDNDKKQEERSDDENEDGQPEKKAAHKKKKYATPVAEFIDVAREKLKIVVR